MRNVTLAIEEEVLRKARIQAAKEGTSVNEVVRRFLREYAGREDRYRKAVEEVLRIAEGKPYASGGRKWKRADLYDRKSLRGR